MKQHEVHLQFAAESISRRLLVCLGFRDPVNISSYARLVELAAEEMSGFAEDEVRRSKQTVVREIVRYEMLMSSTSWMMCLPVLGFWWELWFLIRIRSKLKLWERLVRREPSDSNRTEFLNHFFPVLTRTEGCEYLSQSVDSSASDHESETSGGVCHVRSYD